MDNPAYYVTNFIPAMQVGMTGGHKVRVHDPVPVMKYKEGFGNYNWQGLTKREIRYERIDNPGQIEATEARNFLFEVPV